MKINSFIISSLLAFASVAGAVKNKNFDKGDHTFRTTTISYGCPDGSGDVSNQLNQCNQLNGKFYSKYHPYPSCYSDYVCFNNKLKGIKKVMNNAISIDGKIYTSADISSIEYCSPKSRLYNFNKCVTEAKKLFSDFHYEFPFLERFTETYNPEPYTFAYLEKTTTTTTTTRIRTLTTTRFIHPFTKTFGKYSEPTNKLLK